MSRSSSDASGPAAEPDLATAVGWAAADAELTAGLCELYASADAAMAPWQHECEACGHCCRLQEFGHRLYVSTAELALLLREPPPTGPTPGQCPYQVGRLCTARTRRTLGCRTFFCRPDLADASRALHERFHAELRRLHEARRIPYRYVELVCGIAAVRDAGVRTG